MDRPRATLASTTSPAAGASPPGPHPAAAPLDVDRAMAGVEATIARAVRCDEPLLQRMVSDLVLAGGKRMRPRLALLAFAACGGGDDRRADAIDAAAAFELIHTASLIHDDIIDQSPLRRGKPTVHVAYGVSHALVAGDFLFARGFGLSARLGPDIIRVAEEACARLAEGEVMEQRLLAEEVDEERYLTIIIKKTAEPIRGCAKAGAMLAGAGPDVVEALGQFGVELGIAFQIADDVLDIAGDPKETGKAVGQDAKTGVLTLPAGILAPGEATTAAPLARDAASFRAMARASDPAELRRLLAESGAIGRARAVAARYAERAKSRLAVLPESAAKTELMALADSVVKRRS